jgi:hypothetical protein
MWPGRIILTGANVEAIERAVTLPLERHRFLRADMPDAGAIGNFTGIGFGSLEEADPAAPVSTMLEVLACESPADRPVPQRQHLVGGTGVDERLGADDRSGATGAIDDDHRLGIRRNAARAEHQFRAGHADGAGYVHGGIFVEPPNVQDRDIGFARNQPCDFFC